MLSKAAIWLIWGIGIVVFGSFFAHLVYSCPPRHGVDFRMRLRGYIPLSWKGRVSELLNAVFALLSCALVIVGTYPEYDTNSFGRVGFAIDLFINNFWMFLYALNFYLSLDRFHFIFELQSLVDAVTIIPSLIALFLQLVLNEASVLHFLGLLRVLRVLRLLRLFRTIRFLTSSGRRITGSDASRVVRLQFANLAMKILACFFLLAGFFNFIVVVTDTDWGAGKGTLSFHNAMYFVTIGFTTVGYGDIAPDDAIGRLVTSFLILAMFCWIPVASAQIARLSQTYPRHSGPLGAGKARKHIIVGCDPSCLQVARGFVKELLLQADFRVPLVVLVVPGEPDLAWSAFLLEYATNDTLKYRNGDLRNVADLEKLRLPDAEACFVLSDRTSHDTISQDRRALMRALTVHDVSPGLELYCLVTHTETRAQMVHMGLDRRRIVCANRLVMQLLAAACRQPGLSTVAANLLCHMPELDPVLKRLGDPERKKGGGGGGWRGLFLRRLWPGWEDPLEGAVLLDTEEQYLKGLQQMLVNIEIGAYYAGHSVRAAALDLYRHCGVVLVALASDDAAGKRGGGVGPLGVPVLYPGGDYVVTAGDKAYVIAHMGYGVDRVNQYCREHRQFLRNTGGDHLADHAPRKTFMAKVGGFVTDRLRGHTSSLITVFAPPGGGLTAAGGLTGVQNGGEEGAMRDSVRDSRVERASILSCEILEDPDEGGPRRSFEVPTTSQIFVPLSSARPRGGSEASGLSERVPGEMRRRASIIPSESDAAGRVVIITQSLVAARRLVFALCGGAGIHHGEDGAGAEPFGGERWQQQAAPVHVTVVCPFHPWNADVDTPLEMELTRHLPGRELRFVRGPLTAPIIAQARPETAQLVCLAAAQGGPRATSAATRVHMGDDEMLQVLATVLTMVGTDVRVVMALNDWRYAEQHAVLSTRMRMLQLLPKRAAMRRLFLQLYSGAPQVTSTSSHHRGGVQPSAYSVLSSGSTHRTSNGTGHGFGGLNLAFGGLGGAMGLGGSLTDASGDAASQQLFITPEYFQAPWQEVRPKFMGHFAVKSGYTSGNVVLANTAELLLVQTYVVPGLADVIEMLLSSGPEAAAAAATGVAAAAAARLHCRRDSESSDEDEVNFLEASVRVRRRSGAAAPMRARGGAFVERAKVPIKFWEEVADGRCLPTYGELAQWLLREEDVPALGLFRRWGSEATHVGLATAGEGAGTAGSGSGAAGRSGGSRNPAWRAANWLRTLGNRKAPGVGDDSAHGSATGSGRYGTGLGDTFRDTLTLVNPAPDMRLSPEDQVYVIVQCQPPDDELDLPLDEWIASQHGSSAYGDIRGSGTSGLGSSTGDVRGSGASGIGSSGGDIRGSGTSGIGNDGAGVGISRRGSRPDAAVSSALAPPPPSPPPPPPPAWATTEVLRAVVEASPASVKLAHGFSIAQLLAADQAAAGSSAGPPPPSVTCALCGGAGWGKGPAGCLAASCGHVLHARCFDTLPTAPSGGYAGAQCPVCREVLLAVLPLAV